MTPTEEFMHYWSTNKTKGEIDEICLQNAYEAGKASVMDIIIDKLIVCFAYSNAHEEDSKKALEDLIAWEIKIALDPAVSTDALKLIELGRKLEREGR